jgi:hypothetical protein
MVDAIFEISVHYVNSKTQKTLTITFGKGTLALYHHQSFSRIYTITCLDNWGTLETIVPVINMVAAINKENVIT